MTKQKKKVIYGFTCKPRRNTRVALLKLDSNEYAINARKYVPDIDIDEHRKACINVLRGKIKETDIIFSEEAMEAIVSMYFKLKNML